MKTIGFHHRWGGSAFVLASLALAGAMLVQPVFATEAQGDLGVQLRLVEMIPPKGPAGPGMTGIAKVEVLVQAFRQTSDIELRILQADGSEWRVKGRPIGSTRPDWTDTGGEPLEPGDDGQIVPARGAIKTTIVVPLEGAAIHEIVVGVTGRLGDEPIATSGVVRAAWGVPDNQPVDDGTHANFSVKGVE